MNHQPLHQWPQLAPHWLHLQDGRVGSSISVRNQGIELVWVANLQFLHITLSEGKDDGVTCTSNGDLFFGETLSHFSWICYLYYLCSDRDFVILVIVSKSCEFYHVTSECLRIAYYIISLYVWTLCQWLDVCLAWIVTPVRYTPCWTGFGSYRESWCLLEVKVLQSRCGHMSKSTTRTIFIPSVGSLLKEVSQSL